MAFSQGEQCANFGTTLGQNTTAINGTNAATEDGTVSHIEIQAYSQLNGLEFGSAQQDDADNFTFLEGHHCDGANLASDGSNCSTFESGLGHFVEYIASSGEFVGCYSTEGYIERNTSGGSGAFFDSGDQIGGHASTVYNVASYADDRLSLWADDQGTAAGSASATVSGTLSAITSGQADQVFVDSDLVATLAAITSVFSVQTVNERTAVLEATLAAITSLSDAEVLVSGDLAGELAAVTSLFENQVLIDAIIAGDLTAITAAIVSSAVPTRSVTIAGTLAAITSVITGEALITCGIAGSLTPITSSFQITIEVQNSIAASLQAIEAVIEANVLVSGDVVAALAAITGRIRARTTVASGISGFPCIDGGSLSILGG